MNGTLQILFTSGATLDLKLVPQEYKALQDWVNASPPRSEVLSFLGQQTNEVDVVVTLRRDHVAALVAEVGTNQ